MLTLTKPDILATDTAIPPTVAIDTAVTPEVAPQRVPSPREIAGRPKWSYRPTRKIQEAVRFLRIRGPK